MARIVPRWRWALAVAALAATAVLGGVSGARGDGASAAPPPRGGTLRAGMPFYHIPLARTPTGAVDFALEPLANLPVPLELDRCCLLRTLLSYNGQPTERGGAVLRPDLAEALPDVSPDGLTWKFRLKRGLHYGPPLEHVEITAHDVIRAVKRRITPLKGPLTALLFTPDVYAPIVGLAAFRSGGVGSISGLEAPDDYTLVVHLTRPAENLGYTFSLPFTAPVPAVSTRGHGLDFSRFLVSSGPYMLAGSDRMDFSRPPREQVPAAGYRPGRSITLVRNPYWDPATDPLRAAYANRIVITYGGTPDGDARKVDRGRLDLVFDSSPPRWQIAKYTARPRLQARLRSGTADALFFLPMNLAVPPFDDLHLRRAVNFAVDKARLLRLYERPATPSFIGATGITAGHLIIDSLEENLLRGWDPYRTPGERGSLPQARREMRRSRYDRDRDGRCDRPACRGVLALTRAGTQEPFWPQWAEVIRRDLAGIGIHLKVRVVPLKVWATQTQFNPARRVPMLLGVRYTKDFPSPSTLFDFFDGRSIRPPPQGVNTSMVGARPALLRQLGYHVTRVSSVDDRIDRCRRQPDSVGTRCWAQLDAYLMQQVVPWVPMIFQTTTRAVSARVVSFSFDQLSNFPALDRIAVAGG
jgi:peptide/nickel transport system substrate-binding protein